MPVVFLLVYALLMGIEDRDYFREDHAKKNGMRYSARNATYSSAEKLFRDAVAPASRPWHPVLRWLLFFSICLCVSVLLSVVSRW